MNAERSLPRRKRNKETVTTPGYSRVTLYGIHPVWETLRAGKRRIYEVWGTEAVLRTPGLGELIEGRGVKVIETTNDHIEKLTRVKQHQGIAAVVGPFPYVNFEEVLPLWSRGLLPVLLLDEVQDPGNLGSILRGAECLGAAGVVLGRDRSAPITAAVEKRAAGASAHVAIARVVNMRRALMDLKEAGYWVFGTEVTAPTTLYSLDLTGQVAFVLGSEATGMRRLVRDSCDRLVSIPMVGNVASLNVAQTAVAVLAEALRQRWAREHTAHEVTRRGDIPGEAKLRTSKRLRTEGNR